MSRLRKVLLCLTVFALAALALWGHLHFWYSPRARMAVLDPSTLPAELLASDDLPFAAWLPYPHQNLAALAATTGEDRGYLEALARLAEVPPPRLPAFGPFPVPPSSEIAMAVGEGGERFAVRARVYPAVALFARLAGVLAKNPWLRGGQVYLEGSLVEVSWQGNVWVVATEGTSLTTSGGEAKEAALAWLRLGREAGPAGAGFYRLGLSDGDGDSQSLELSSENPPTRRLGLESDALAELPLFLLLLSGGGPAEGPGGRALAFFEAASGDSRDLPRTASLALPGARPFRLPGEDLLGLGGRSPRRGEREGWRISAIDQACLEGAGALAPRLQPLLLPAPLEVSTESSQEPSSDQEALSSEKSLAWGLWLDMERGAAEVARIASIFDALPESLVADEDLQRWRDARRVLAPLERRFQRITGVATGVTGGLRIRFVPRQEEETGKGIEETPGS